MSGFGSLRIPGKAANSWSISADGRVHPDVEGAGKFDGLVPGSIIQVGSSQSIHVCVCESAHLCYCERSASVHEIELLRRLVSFDCDKMTQNNAESRDLFVQGSRKRGKREFSYSRQMVRIVFILVLVL